MYVKYMYISRFFTPTTMSRFIRVRARVGPQQLVPDEHGPRRAYETTNKQNPRPTSVEQQPRGARAASYGEGAASGGIWCRAPGTHVRKGIAIAVTFPGADVRSAGRVGTALRGFLVAAASWLCCLAHPRYKAKTTLRSPNRRLTGA